MYVYKECPGDFPGGSGCDCLPGSACQGRGEAPALISVITADPNWYETGGGKRGAQEHYPIMKTPDIIELLLDPVRCEPLTRVDPARSALFLWVTNNFLRDGLEVLDALGYRYITNLVWAKDRPGLGYYFSGQHELCLFAVKGKWARLPKVPGTPENRRN